MYRMDIKMNDILEQAVYKQLSRRKVMPFVERNIGTVNEKFQFRMLMDGYEQTFFIRHFAEIELVETGETWSFIDFLDEHFSQKRSTIMNNLAKCLNLKKPNGGNL